MLMRTLATLQEPDTGEIVFDGSDVMLYVGKHRLRTGANEISFEVRGHPGFISADPFERRIEVERADNVRALSVPRE